MTGEGFAFGFSSSLSLSDSDSDSDSSDSLLSLSLGFAGVRTAVVGVWFGNGGRVVSLRCVAGVPVVIGAGGAVVGFSEDSSSDSSSYEVLTSVAFDVSAWVVVAIVSSSSLSLSATGVGAFGVGGEPE